MKNNKQRKKDLKILSALLMTGVVCLGGLNVVHAMGPGITVEKPSGRQQDKEYIESLGFECKE